jgi:hypothetical protein
VKIESLFEPRRHPARSLRGELDAVRAGDKPIAMEAWPIGALDEDYDRFVALGRARGLEIVEREERALHAVYAVTAREAWRIDALHALWQVVPARGWSDGAEALESHLLGYTPAQIERWLAERHRERLGWHGVTIHVVMARALRRHTTPRWFPHGDATIAWCDGTLVPKRRRPVWVAKRRLSIVRAAIAGEHFYQLFGRRGRVRSCELDPAELNPMLVANIEL